MLPENTYLNNEIIIIDKIDYVNYKCIEYTVKKEKNSCAYSGVFSKVMLGERMISIILGSLLAILDTIQRR